MAETRLVGGRPHRCGELHLHEAPVITGVKALINGTELLGPAIQSPVELFGIQPVGKGLRLFRVGDKEEGSISHLEGYAGFFQFPHQPAMAIEVDLQAEGRPGWHPNVTEAEVLVDKVEVVMEAFA